MECYRNLGLALAAILVIVLTLVPSLCISSLIFLAIASTIVEVAGFMHWWGLYIDNVTVVMLVVSVGISVDYAAHVGYAFQQYQHGSTATRAARAMTEMGSCVWHGFFSTFLAIVVLAPSKSYVFTSFFKQLFLASTLGIFNGLFVLPVMLKLGVCSNVKDEEEQSELPKAGEPVVKNDNFVVSKAD
jgi:multidrug efflux pump subunit AcrB